ncbi:unnamed protein product, partial [Phaeothamnion confervicola]
SRPRPVCVPPSVSQSFAPNCGRGKTTLQMSLQKKLVGRWSSAEVVNQEDLPSFVEALEQEFSVLELTAKLRGLLALLAAQHADLTRQPLVDKVREILDIADNDPTTDKWLPVVSGLVREWLGLPSKQEDSGGSGATASEPAAQATAYNILPGPPAKAIETPYFLPLETPYLCKRLQPSSDLFENVHFQPKLDKIRDLFGMDSWDWQAEEEDDEEEERIRATLPAAEAAATLGGASPPTAVNGAASGGAVAVAATLDSANAVDARPSSEPTDDAEAPGAVHPPRSSRSTAGPASSGGGGGGVPLRPGSIGQLD